MRLIYRLFMQGQTPYAIAKYLTDKSISTPMGKETWRHRTVENILSNEKYMGDARLQKCYTVDFNEKLFHRLVDYATVYPDGRVVFTFRNGAEVSTKI